MSVGLPVARKSSDKPKATSESRKHGHLVRLGSDVVLKARKVAALRGITMAEYITDCMTPIVDADLEAEGRKLTGGKK